MSAEKETYPLKDPFTFEGKEIASVQFRPLKGKDLLAVEREIKARGGSVASAGEMENTFHLVSRSVGLPFEAIEEMGAADVMALAGKAQGFL